jgi:hypothetical protein
LVVVTVTLVQKEGSPVSIENAKLFLEALEKEETLRRTVSIQDSVVKVAKLWTHDLGLTAQDLENAIEEKWGQSCVRSISRFCFSEVPGF